MRVVRERVDTRGADRSCTDDLSAHVADTGEPALRVWYPPAHVAFGRRDAATEGYGRAVQAAEALGYHTVERAVGGRAVAFTGDVLAVVLAEPADATAPAIESRYDETVDALVAALKGCGANVTRGEPPNSFCPGTHSLQTDGSMAGDAGGKVAGLAQRVRRDVAVVAGVVIVRDAAGDTEVLTPIYDALGVPFDPESVGSVAVATPESVDPDQFRNEIESALVGDRPTAPLNFRDT